MKLCGQTRQERGIRLMNHFLLPREGLLRQTDQCLISFVPSFLNLLYMFLTLHVHNQQCVADSQWCPEPEGLCRREEVFIDD